MANYYDDNSSGYPEDDAEEYLDLEEQEERLAQETGESSRRRLSHDYEDDLDRDYRRVREQAQQRRKDSERARAAQARRRAKREAEVRRARRNLILVLVAAAAAVAAILVGVQLVRHGLPGRGAGKDAAVAEGSSTQSTASAQESTEGASAADTASTEAGEDSTLPSAEQVAADRAAKNYSPAVSTFWPYYTFHTTAQTKEIPSIPSDEEAYLEKYGASASAAGSSDGDVSAVGEDSGVSAGSNPSTADGNAVSAADNAADGNSAATGNGAAEGSSDTAATESSTAENISGNASLTASTEEAAAGTTATADDRENSSLITTDDAEETADGAENAAESTSELTMTADGNVITNTGAEVPPADVVGGDYVSSYFGIVVDADTGDILAQKRMQDRIVPASMTKVMTLLVAVEQMGLTEDSPTLHDMVTLTTEDEEFAYINGSSAVCWMPGDTASVEDLMYGTILPSGADAAMALAEKTAGTADNFVKLMNEKAQELGISDTTHFTNCVGVYDENHYSTVYDIAVIMKAALENDLCRKILSEHTWTTSPTSEHPEGITVSNWFLRRIEDKDTKGTVLCAKTGFVNQSGYCGVSYQECDNGKHLIVCTADSWGNWRCINDHVALYNEYSE